MSGEHSLASHQSRYGPNHKILCSRCDRIMSTHVSHRGPLAESKKESAELRRELTRAQSMLRFARKAAGLSAEKKTAPAEGKKHKRSMDRDKMTPLPALGRPPRRGSVDQRNAVVATLNE